MSRRSRPRAATKASLARFLKVPRSNDVRLICLVCKPSVETDTRSHAGYISVRNQEQRTNGVNHWLAVSERRSASFFRLARPPSIPFCRVLRIVRFRRVTTSPSNDSSVWTFVPSALGSRV